AGGFGRAGPADRGVPRRTHPHRPARPGPGAEAVLMADGPDIAALDERLARALADRLAAGAPTRPGAAAIALRAALAAAPDLPTELGVAVWRRIEAAAASRPIAVWGPAGAAAAGRFGSALGLAAEPRAALDHARQGGLAVLALAAQNP